MPVSNLKILVLSSWDVYKGDQGYCLEEGRILEHEWEERMKIR
jgi:hypothetical protein